MDRKSINDLPITVSISALYAYNVHRKVNVTDERIYYSHCIIGFLSSINSVVHNERNAMAEGFYMLIHAQILFFSSIVSHMLHQI